MKTIILIILMSGFVFGLIAGTPSVIETFENCKNITVNVTGEENIDSGEYWFTNCSEMESNLWNCECEGDYNLTLETKINTVNKYNFTIFYEILIEESTPSETSGGSSGGGGHSFEHQDEIIKGNKTWKDDYEDLPEVNETQEPKKETPKEEITIQEPQIQEPQKKSRLLLWIIIGFVSLGVIGFIIWFMKNY